MEKVCEFCMASIPVVYCQPDAAHLCLSCDSKVHSANALSHRHLRTLLCFSCRSSPADTHCLDHKMYICNICDRRLHNGTSQHRKRILNCYMGCPTANDLAKMWNVDLSGSSSNARMDLLVSSASAASISSVSSFTYRQTKVSLKARQQQSSSLMLQQILDLRRLQSSVRNESSHVLLRNQEKNVISKSCPTADWTAEDTTPVMRTRRDLSTERDGQGEPPGLKLAETCPSPFSQLENLPSTSTAITSLPGEMFWQLRSPQSNQFWSQNMEDIGLCEESFQGTDLDIPDIDVTFPNFEEAFRGEEDSMRESLGEETSCSFANIDTSAATSDEGHTNAASGAAPVHQADASSGDNVLGSSSQAKTDWRNTEAFGSLSPSYPNDRSVESGPSPSNAGGGRLSDDIASDHPRSCLDEAGRPAERKRTRGKSSKLKEVSENGNL
ncbi:hypothetical protein MLD38_003903 [Melastoma candidum]|uniref:Uncharacterized protein n=1 Tax=Melastoma candidum TaxID=119954 RepID=A0ACB9S5Y5_9MYRT|nr:hypothetical protein MLD38_003903 [Melastoma candidum]